MRPDASNWDDGGIAGGNRGMHGSAGFGAVLLDSGHVVLLMSGSGASSLAVLQETVCPICTNTSTYYFSAQRPERAILPWRGGLPLDQIRHVGEISSSAGGTRFAARIAMIPDKHWLERHDSNGELLEMRILPRDMTLSEAVEYARRQDQDLAESSLVDVATHASNA